MTYYLLLEGDTEKDAYYDSNVLGEESFGMFYTGQGMVALTNIVNKKPELLESIKILDETKKSYTLTKFFDILSKLKIKSTNTTMLCHHHIKKTYNAGDTIWARASVVCNAKTKKDTNCKLKTKHWSGKCHHHRD